MKQKLTDKGYLNIGLTKNKKQITFLVHRLVLLTFLPMEEKEVDHINHIKSDNRLINLRWATRSENQRYKKKQEGRSSQYIGVYYEYNKWRVRYRCLINKKYILVGWFNDEIEAAKAYNAYIITNNLQDNFYTLNNV
jgi:hypothetical protein